jgi:cytoskeleton-binding toxin CbtA-like protein
MAEDNNLERIDNRRKSFLPVSPLLTPADILSAQNAVGLAGSNASLMISGQSSVRS